MEKSLVIVESPAKAKTINKYLGRDYIVKSSIGHIRDLPKGGRSTVDSAAKAKEAAKVRKMGEEEKRSYLKQRDHIRLCERMGLNPEDGWRARYEIIQGKQRVVSELKKLAYQSQAVYLATDMDREGEAIAWHLTQVMGEGPIYKRVVFNEITQKAINKAFQEPSEVDYNCVNAQQARRFLDRIVGFMLSPLLWKKVAYGLSAGRVQSVAVRLIVEREREIKSFIPEEYWTLKAALKRQEGEITEFEVVEDAGGKYKPTNAEASATAVTNLQQQQFIVEARNDKPTKSKAPPPLITSTLQQVASSQLGLAVKQTMRLAQRLYEAGYITYMRTDSTNLSQDAINDCRQYINEQWGATYLPPKPNRYSSKRGAQEAHEAIRPTNVKLTATSLSNVEASTARLYQLIWQRFVACQMPAAEFISTKVTVRAGDYLLQTKGRVMQFDGYQRVAPVAIKKEDEQELPDFKAGEALSLVRLDPQQNFTKPALRYSEASLVKELEKKGIGRPSTYANIISTIQERGFVSLDNRRFYAQKIGEIVTQRLRDFFSDLMDYNFTARMEEQLDDIALGKKNWKQTLDEFYHSFQGDLDKAEQGMSRSQPVQIQINCLKCQRPMQIRNGPTGVFLGCSGYGLPSQESCKATLSLTEGDNAVASHDEKQESLSLRTRLRCSQCNSIMEPWLIDEKRMIHICVNNPDCDGYKLEQGSFKVKGYDGPILDCDKCQSQMQLKEGRFGKYFDCTSESCNNTRKLLSNGQPAPPKINPIPMPELRCKKVDDYYLLRDGAAGLFLAASQYPKHRETRAPRVSELKPHAEALDAKYHYLLQAPDKDNKGNDVFIRYSRKHKLVYIRGEQNGKPTGWSAYYKNKQWLSEP